ncbi:hypothetical protein V6N11_043635 [Hibiscus sabdariffa]|uniref:Uncharacterized protein n=1 Tax=Hibiscus sabdariffa TaxID=183260 RepID=A0ABR2RCU2_9ROSI
MRSAANRQWLRSTQGVDIELTLITMVAEPIAPLTTGIAVEIPDGINWRREEAEGVAGMAGMSDQTRQLTAGSVEVEVAGAASLAANVASFSASLAANAASFSASLAAIAASLSVSRATA